MTEMSETAIMSASGCPVSHTDYTVQQPLFETYELLNAERERGPFLWNDSRPRPFWMITDYQHVLEALQMPDVFSNEVVSALNPKHMFDLLPQQLDPPEHTAQRRVVNRWFAPAAVRRLEPLVLSRCDELIDELRPQGGCDLVSDFAIRFPTDLFLATLNLPISDGAVFLEHVENVFKSFAGRGLKQAAISTEWIRGYFDRAIADREQEPQDTETDFISRLLVAKTSSRSATPRCSPGWTPPAAPSATSSTTSRLTPNSGTGSPRSPSCGPRRWRSSCASTRWSTRTAA
jgi:cytochrome P450